MPEDGLVYPISTNQPLSFYNTGQLQIRFDVLFYAAATGRYLGLL